ncbi:hypothetical protein BH09BAC4_BH09BAC4_40580 [soil metagenome]
MKLPINRNSFWAIWLLFLLPGAKADLPADQILGRWLFPSKGSSVDIYRIGNQYFARVAEVDKAGEKNYGLIKDKVLIRNLTYDGEVWSDGDLVHPKTGMTLSVEVHLSGPHTITVTVYKGIKLLHKKFIMTRQTA